MNLPVSKGTFILIARVSRAKTLKIGSLGKCKIEPGYYAFVSSALGAGGLRSRLRDLESPVVAHWHIDYLLQTATLMEVWFTTAEKKLEDKWAELLDHREEFSNPIPRFGSSDYHLSRVSRLFYSKRRPSFAWFQKQVREQFDGVAVGRHRVAPAA
jgi:Uri superfamily endonuclease